MKTRKTFDTRHSAQEHSSAGRRVPSAPQAIFLVGPSAVGKSAVAFELAKRLEGEIVSCDAMQVYKELAVASDRPTDAVTGAVPHHLLGVVSVVDGFNVARYRELAIKAINDILSRGRTPLVCGGSGMYMMALLDGLFAGGEADAAVRENLEREVETKGLPELYGRLRSVDPAAAVKIKPSDRQRIVRALEVFGSTGVPISQLQPKRDGLWEKLSLRLFALERPREELYARAERRVEEMFARGLVEEVRAVRGLKMSASSARLIGVPEVMEFLDGAYDLARTKELMKRNTRHYIKRQLTWFRRDQRLEWLMIQGQEPAEATAERIMLILASPTGKEN